jgi:hypothetical protein
MTGEILKQVLCEFTHEVKYYVYERSRDCGHREVLMMSIICSTTPVIRCKLADVS